MSMNNAALELALRQAMSRLTAALAGRDAPNSLKLEGLTLAQVTASILAGTAANATLFDGHTYAEVLQAITGGSAETLATLEAQFDAFVARTDNPHAVTKAQVGLGNVDNFVTATQADADAKAVDKFLTPFVADYMVQKAVDALVGAAPETLNTINELAAALNNDPDLINNLMSEIGTKETPAGAQAKADQAEADAIAAAAADATAKAAQAVVDANAYTDAAIAGVDASLERATQLEAEAGLDNVKLMTSLRTAQAIAAIGATLFLGKTEQAADSAMLEGNTLAQVIAAAQAGVDMSNVVQKTDDFGQYSVGASTLAALITALQTADTTNAGDVAALQTAFNAFVAAKASSAEVQAGTDDVKYTTSLGVKTAITAAIDALVDAAPEALNTINELAAALNNDPDVINNLTSLIGTKLTQAQVQAEIATALVPVDARIDALEAAVGEGSDFLQAGVDDLGANPVAVVSDVVTYTANEVNGGLATYSVVRNSGELTVQVDPDLNGVFEAPAEALAAEVLAALDAALTTLGAVDGTTYYVTTSTTPKTLKQHLEALEAETQALDDRITGEVAGLNAAITNSVGTLEAADQANADAIAALTTSTSAADAALDARLDTLEAAAPNLQTKDGSLDTNVVTVDVGGTPTATLLPTVLADLKAYIASVEASGSGDLTALQNSFNAFVAAKATGAEVIAGTDDAKYTTSLAVKAAIDNAISELAGTAPEALNTINELAAALNNDPDIINQLMTQISTKLDATGTAADSAKLGGVAAADYATKAYVDSGLEAITEGFIASALDISSLYSGDLTIADLGGGSYGFNASGSINPTLFGTTDSITRLSWDGSVVTLVITGDQTTQGIDAIIVDGEVLNAFVSATFATGSTTFVFTQDHALPNTGTVPVLF